MSSFIKRSLPPGFSYKTELRAVVFTLVASFLVSLGSFYAKFAYEKQALYVWRGGAQILSEGAVMPDFTYILGDRLNILLILAALAFVIISAIHYAYFTSGSKSIYLMRRLPNRLELHRRSLLLPFIYALAFLLTAFLLLLLFYAIYMLNTPKACLAPEQWQAIWR